MTNAANSAPCAAAELAASAPLDPSRRARSVRGRCCGGALSPNERALVVTSCLFSGIVLAQFVGAYLSRSRALLLDSVSMLVDVSTYGANLWTECAPPSSARRAEAREVLVAGLSLFALWTITLIGTVQAIFIIHAHRLDVAGASAAPDANADAVDGRIVLGFALVGLVVDTISLLEIRSSSQHAERAAAERDGALRELTASELAPAASCDTAAEHTPPARRGARASCARICCVLELNMSSALAHVLADTFRSSTTLVASLLILGLDWDSALVDGAAAVVVAAVIVLAALGTTRRWALACWRFVAAPSPAPLSTRDETLGDDADTSCASRADGESAQSSLRLPGGTTAVRALSKSTGHAGGAWQGKLSA
jgi:Co/Zn/Cd efflux system component